MSVLELKGPSAPAMAGNATPPGETEFVRDDVCTDCRDREQQEQEITEAFAEGFVRGARAPAAEGRALGCGGYIEAAAYSARMYLSDYEPSLALEIAQTLNPAAAYKAIQHPWETTVQRMSVADQIAVAVVMRSIMAGGICWPPPVEAGENGAAQYA